MSKGSITTLLASAALALTAPAGAQAPAAPGAKESAGGSIMEAVLRGEPVVAIMADDGAGRIGVFTNIAELQVGGFADGIAHFGRAGASDAQMVCAEAAAGVNEERGKARSEFLSIHCDTPAGFTQAGELVARRTGIICVLDRTQFTAGVTRYACSVQRETPTAA